MVNGLEIQVKKLEKNKNKLELTESEKNRET